MLSIPSGRAIPRVSNDEPELDGDPPIEVVDTDEHEHIPGHREQELRRQHRDQADRRVGGEHPVPSGVGSARGGEDLNTRRVARNAVFPVEGGRVQGELQLVGGFGWSPRRVGRLPRNDQLRAPVEGAAQDALRPAVIRPA